MAIPSGSTYSGDATKRMLPSAAASSAATGTTTGADATGAKSFAMNGMLSPTRLPSNTKSEDPADYPSQAL